MDFVQGVAITASLLIFFVVIDLIRRNLLKERYSLIWLATAFVLLLFSVWRHLLDLVALAIGIYYPPSFLFLLAITFLLILLLHFSIVISSLSEKNKSLAQEIGILQTMMKGLEEKTGTAAKPEALGAEGVSSHEREQQGTGAGRIMRK